MTCLTCAHSQINDPTDARRSKSLKDMAKQGFIVCNRSFCRATFHGFDHECSKYIQASDEVVRARVKWRNSETRGR